MRISITAAVLVGLTGSGMGQMTGVSHPDETPITTSADGSQQIITYQPAQPSVLKPRIVEPAASTAPTVVATSMRSDRQPILAEGMAAPVLTEDTRLGIVSAADYGVITRVAGPANQLPVGTVVKVRIRESLSTKSTAVGAVFNAELIEPVLRDGRVLLPVGSSLSGHVTEVHGGKRVSGAASMHLTTQDVTLPDGTVYPVHGQVVDTDLFRATKIDQEGTILRRDHKVETLGAMTLSTGSGAAAGAVFGGWPGALVGAAVGAGMSTVVWLKQDHQTELPAGTGVSFLLTEPIMFQLP